jgi:peptidoglycan lytic transglycosylase G
MRRFLIAIFLLTLLSAAAFFAEQWTFFAPGPWATHGRATAVWIRPGVRSAQIAQQLQRAGIVRNAAFFRLGVMLRGKNAALKAGEYAIPSGASMAEIMGILTVGKSIEHRLTAAEGLTSAMIYDIVRRDPMLVGDADTQPAEGTLLPETYLYARGTARREILDRMARAQQKFLVHMWPARTPGLPYTSLAEAITLASIVEKETALPEERPHIAAVFINRLRLGMKLQSDPTIIYGLTKGYPLGRGIRESELAAPSPYNTYVNAGLPPTPICNPGKASIEAVLHPEVSSDVYFVANGKGGHVFTSSLAQHEQNVAKWRQIEKGNPSPRPPLALAPQPNDNALLKRQADAAATNASTAPRQNHRRSSRRRRVRF